MTLPLQMGSPQKWIEWMDPGSSVRLQHPDHGAAGRIGHPGVFLPVGAG